MFDIVKKSLTTGIVTTKYPVTPPEVSQHVRGRPEIDFNQWRDARSSAEVCPTGAIGFQDQSDTREATLDLAKCTFCGLCADLDPAIRMTTQVELAETSRAALIFRARYRLKPDGSHHRLLETPPPTPVQIDREGQELKATVFKLLGRSLHIREVDAGSCNGCEIEIVGLNSPVYDVERFGLHFVASPRHADLLLVTGPVTRNMELALRKTYEAMPGPRLVVAVGACGCSGGIFGHNYATCGGVDQVLPVDVYIPGCPPNPQALIHGILLAVGRLTRVDGCDSQPLPAGGKT
jgi:Ni,Fe-hydrogenase III small subunit/formate hydrogenlyase subunit 6/NADH:ubiquinone oxidoreductase subunit I